MSVKQSYNFLAQQRVDLVHLRMLESGNIYDFQTLTKLFTDSNPYILSGFTIPITGINGPAAALQIVVDSASVFIPANKEGPFLRVDAGTANETLSTNNTKVTGAFAANQDNYVGIRFSRATDPTTADLVTFWDVDAKVEFPKTVPLGLVLNYEFVISQTDFSDTASIAVVTTNLSNNVIRIKNAQSKFGRLARGGVNPNISYNEVLSPAIENNLTATSPSDPDPFAGGDLEINSFKQLFDKIMTRFKEITGSPLWYADGNVTDITLNNLFFDTAGSVVTGVGTFEHSNATPGLLTWTSDMYLKSIIGPLTYVISQGTITLTDGQVAYISLVRDQDFQSANIFTFTNGSNTVSGTINVTGIAAGDWIKDELHDTSKYAQVLSIVGSTITLTSTYQGATTTGKALRSQGTYSMQSASPASVPASGNTFWIAKRNDNAVPNAAIATPANSGATRTTGIATIKTIAAHGFKIGQSISVSGTSDSSFNANAQIIDVPTSTTLTYDNPGPNVVMGVVGNGQVSSRAKVYLRYIGELEQGESRQIDDNTTDNILRFIGSPNESTTIPPYSAVPNGLSPFQYPNPNPGLTTGISIINENVNDIFTTLSLPSYDEPLLVVTGAPANDNQIAGPVTSGATLTLPFHSRRGDIVQDYTVGKGGLEVYVNGQYLQLHEAGGWTEIGAPGTSSSTIIINQNLAVGTVVTFRIDATGGPGSGGANSPAGDFITLPTSSTADNSDYIAIYDVSVPGYRKQTRATFLSGIGTGLNVNTYSSNVIASATLDDVLLINASGGNVTIGLPAAVSCDGKVFYIKKIDATLNLVIIDPNASETIDGNFTQAFSAQYQSFTIVSSGVSWSIL